MTDLLTPDEMAAILRVPRSWLYDRTRRTRKKGKPTIPITRVGKYIRFEKDKVLEWIQNGGAPAKRA